LFRAISVRDFSQLWSCNALIWSIRGEPSCGFHQSVYEGAEDASEGVVAQRWGVADQRCPSLQGEGSLEARMEALEQEVFKYKEMAKREVDIIHRINQELVTKYKKETIEL
jgi:hypothetical protein